jgi:hypothetical protein
MTQDCKIAWLSTVANLRNEASLASRLLSGQADRYNSGFFIKQKKELTSLPVVRYG